MSFTSPHLLAALANAHIDDLRREADDARLVRAAAAGRPGTTGLSAVGASAARLRAGLLLGLTRAATASVQVAVAVHPRRAGAPAECCA